MIDFIKCARQAIGKLMLVLIAAMALGADSPRTSQEIWRVTNKEASSCQFVLPRVQQNAEYVSRLGDLTLFKSCKTEGSYLYYHEWYSNELPWRRLGSRGMAVLVIALGAILPLVVNWRKTEAQHKVWVPVIGALIVVAQGVSQTFAYETAWRDFMIARMKLEAAQDGWRHELIKASLDSSPSGLARMEAATDCFAKQVSEIVIQETSGFFTAVEAAEKSRTVQPARSEQ